MPDSSGRISHFVSHEPEAIISWIGLDLIYYGAGRGPGHDSRLRSHRVTNVIKKEAGWTATYTLLTVGDIVKHVALVWMRLAPGVFTRGNVSGFGKVARAYVLRGVEIVNLHPNPVRYAIVGVASVVVCTRREISRERVDPCARSDLGLDAIQAGDIRIGAARAKVRADSATAGVAGAADAFF